MNFKKFENRFLKEKNQPEKLIRAKWSHIRFKPDLVTMEELAIGVLVNLDGIVFTKFIEDFGRVECAFGVENASYIKSCIELFDDFLNHNYETSFSSQLTIDKRGFVQGESIDSIIEDLLYRTVPLSHPHSNSKGRKIFRTVKTSKFHADVRAYVKDKLGEIYSDIFSDNIEPVGDEDIGFRKLPIALNVKGKNKVGDLISSVYATPEKIEINCLKALNNISFTKKFTKKKSDFKLFMLSPDNENLDIMSKADKEKRIEIIKDFRWSLGCEKIDLVEGNTSEEISEKIINWSEICEIY
ncbi:hypothetical protein DIW83_01155 [Acinetobacter nosocomialis]|uniref:hypothetical protein n=1 Tax=Acinetobacter nosocomialis TaxID=106654 RepID=UPI0002D4F9D7|nr:hypothetical protein [Acinetobacter nosocomialis]AWL17756.1 hypothetical protein DIW83_01155 [Acinetobacter nosocomialis]